MTSITIWALESDNDAKVAQCLAKKLISYQELPSISIRRVGKTAPKMRKQAKGSPIKALKQAVRRYLQQDDYVIFVIDTDGPISSHKRRQEPNSLINQVEAVLADSEFTGKVYLVQAIHEIEAWLLIDCAGIICFYAQKRRVYKQKSRQEISTDKRFKGLKKYQKGNTELIVEVQMGGQGAKEYLVKFSEDILLALNPNMPAKNIKQERYRENTSPQIAKYIEINRQTLKRNNSLGEFGRILAQCSQT